MSTIHPVYPRHPDGYRKEARLAAQPAARGQDRGARSEAAGDWVNTTLRQIPVWQEAVRLVHLRWSIAHRALATGERHCRDTAGPVEIEGIRSDERGFNRTVLVSLDPSQAEAEHARTADMLARLAMCELIGVIEQIAVKAYRLFLLDNPSLVLDSGGNDGMNRLYARRFEKPEAWEKSWSRHVDRTIDDLRSGDANALVLCHWRQAGLTMPKRGLCATVEDLAAAIGFFLTIRENMLERADTVGPALARLSDRMEFEDFRFVQDSPLVVGARQIELVEAFFHEYLEILRRALQERDAD